MHVPCFRMLQHSLSFSKIWRSGQKFLPCLTLNSPNHLPRRLLPKMGGGFRSSGLWIFHDHVADDIKSYLVWDSILRKQEPELWDDAVQSFDLWSGPHFYNSSMSKFSCPTSTRLRISVNILVSVRFDVLLQQVCKRCRFSRMERWNAHSLESQTIRTFDIHMQYFIRS